MNVAPTNARPGAGTHNVRLVGFSDPALLGLLGFAFATMTAQFASLGLAEEGVVFWVGAIFGGILQIVAGLQAFRIADHFHFLVFSAFGWYWILSPGLLLAHHLEFFDIGSSPRGAPILFYALLTLAFIPGGAISNSVLPATLTLVALGLAGESLSELLGVEGLGVVGAWLLLFSSFGACYMLVAKFYLLVLGWRLPLGPPWMSRRD